jgi:hypothetical protein
VVVASSAGGPGWNRYYQSGQQCHQNQSPVSHGGRETSAEQHRGPARSFQPPSRVTPIDMRGWGLHRSVDGGATKNRAGKARGRSWRLVRARDSPGSLTRSHGSFPAPNKFAPEDWPENTTRLQRFNNILNSLRPGSIFLPPGKATRCRLLVWVGPASQQYAPSEPAWIMAGPTPIEASRHPGANLADTPRLNGERGGSLEGLAHT